MLGRGVRLGKIINIEIWLDFSWLIIFALLLWTLSSSVFPQQYPGFSYVSYISMGAISALTLFASVLLHELSHSYVAQREGIQVPKITLFIFGGVAQISEEPKSAKAEFNIAIAGPVCSLVLAALFWLVSRSPLVALDVRLVAVCKYLAFVNLILVIFNMIPGFPLDGGRILRAYLWSKWRNVRKATYTVSRIGSGFGITLIVLGVFVIITSRGRNLIGGIWFIFIGMFLNNAAKSGYRMTLLKDALAGVRIRDVMTSKVVSVPPEITVSELVREYFHRHIFVSFPVVDANGMLLGVVSLKQVREVPQDEWSTERVGDIMLKASEISAVNPEDDTMAALNTLMKGEMGRIPVVEEGGRLVGIISRRDIMTLLSIKTDLGE